MNYLVMECHLGYAVVLDSAGSFFKVANMGYQVGQIVSDVTKINVSIGDAETKKSLKRICISIASMSACLCLIIFGVWQFMMTPYGTVRIQINPDVRLAVNRIDYVIGVEGLNEDGEDLIESYNYSGKRVEQVSDKLADRAVRMGYLKNGGTIHVTVESDNEEWKRATEDHLIIELEIHTGGSITIAPNVFSESENEKEMIIPIKPSDSTPPADVGEVPDDDYESGGSDDYNDDYDVTNPDDDHNDDDQNDNADDVDDEPENLGDQDDTGDDMNDLDDEWEDDSDTDS